MKEAKALIEKYKAGTCTPEEMRLIDKWLLETHMGERSDLSAGDFEQISREVWLNVLAKREQKPAKQVKLWPRIAVAAAAVAAVVFGVWFYEIASSRKASRNDGTVDMAKVNDIAPGKNGATITLANGKVIQLDSARSGVVVGGGKIFYSSPDNIGTLHNEIASISRNEFGTGSRNDGQGVNGKGGEAGASAQTLTASTARGQTYQFTLPDGTKVWLNADSKLEFPSNFVDSRTRNVKLTGEGYFEVAKSYTSLRGRRTKQSFIVETKRQQIEVLGTHFNISAYANDVATKTTLLEGKVAVTESGRKPVSGSGTQAYGGRKLILDPGGQAYSGPDGIRGLRLSNPEDVMAWKDGKYRFENASLEEVMRQLSRWYDIEVQYEGPVPERSFTGGIDRKSNLSTAIAILKNLNISFELKGRTITIRNHS